MCELVGVSVGASMMSMRMSMRMSIMMSMISTISIRLSVFKLIRLMCVMFMIVSESVGGCK